MIKEHITFHSDKYLMIIANHDFLVHQRERIDENHTWVTDNGMKYKMMFDLYCLLITLVFFDYVVNYLAIITSKNQQIRVLNY